MVQGQRAYEEILGHFGRELMQEDGTIDRTLSAQKRCLRNEQAREWLNGVIHPAVMTGTLREYVAGPQGRAGDDRFGVGAAT